MLDQRFFKLTYVIFLMSYTPFDIKCHMASEICLNSIRVILQSKEVLDLSNQTC